MSYLKPFALIVLCSMVFLLGCQATINVDDSQNPDSAATQRVINEPTLTDWMEEYDLDNATFITLKPHLKALQEEYLNTFSKPGWFHITRKIENYVYQFSVDNPEESVYDFPSDFFDKVPPMHIWEAWYELNEDGLKTGRELHVYYHLDLKPTMVVLELADPLVSLKYFVTDGFELSNLIPEENPKLSASTGVSIASINLDPLANLQNYQTKKSEFNLEEAYQGENKTLNIELITPYDSTLCTESPWYPEEVCGTVIHYELDLAMGYPRRYSYGKYGVSGNQYVDEYTEITTIEILPNLSAEASSLLQKMESSIP